MASRAFEALVLGAQSVAESDRIVRLLSAERGRLDVYARGARASRKRFAGVLEPGTRVRATVADPRKGSLPNLTAADWIQGPDKARGSYDRLMLLAYGCEVVGALTAEEAPAPKLYRLALTWIARMESGATPGDAVRLAFEAKALTFAGLTPALRTCGACGEPLNEPVVWDSERGGACHAACGDGPSVAVEALQTIEALRRTPLAEIDPGPPIPPGVRWILAEFIEHWQGRKLKSRALLP